jgi:hypothetical protein
MGWYSERIKGSNLAKQRHRVSLAITLGMIGLGALFS